MPMMNKTESFSQGKKNFMKRQQISVHSFLRNGGMLVL